ncbi:hypothetical protein LOTGIDRAFT_238343 [Lottia gigantea]|uniref:CUB domain-containing protein n=1 Tax=Lottia gigantea TaxID=225164 RepID=V4AV11_LOTGI|nr:hypothetical protein LOTGIDRAFT_238343 [Lottia gigantea]ESP01138.1 hypothetical protein LOTGIDRAFT_238343 [Lottia gigantea]
MGRRGYHVLQLLALVLIPTTILAVDRVYDMDRLSTCRQEVTIYDFNVILNGKANAAPANPPQECTIMLKSGYTDGKSQLEVAINEVQIEDCAVFVDIFNGKGAFGNYLRRLGCNSENKDKLYSDSEWITIRFTRPVILYQTVYVFKLTVTTWEDPDVPGLFLGGTILSPGVIIGIVAGLLLVIVLFAILIWCWRSGRIYNYIGTPPEKYDSTKQKIENGEYNSGLDKSETNSVKSGIDHRDPAVWSTLAGEKQHPSYRPPGGHQYINRRTYQDSRARTFDNRDPNGVMLNGGCPREQINLKQALIANRQRSVNGGSSTQFRKETLIDDVFESDDNQVEAPHENFQRGHHSRSSKRSQDNDEKRSSLRSNAESPSRDSRHGDSPSRSPRRSRHGESPSRDELQRGTEARDSNRSTSSQKDNKIRAKSLAQEASEARLKSRNDNAEDSASDIDSASVMSIPEPDSHHKTHSKNRQNEDSNDDSDNSDDSDDSEVREITNKSKNNNPDLMVNPNHSKSQKSKNIDPDLMVNPNHSKSQKSPKNKKKKRKSKSKDRDEDVLPPEAFEPLFDRPVSEEPLPDGMQPLNTAYNNPYGMYPGMYPMTNYGMPYGMMPAPGTVAPGTQTYAYAYQAMPAPGMPPQQAGQAAFIVQETPTRDGKVQKKAFMMTQEGQPHPNSRNPGAPGYSSTPYGDPSQRGSGRQRSHTPPSKNIIPQLPQDNGQGHRTAMMKSGVDPKTGIETNQVLWTDTTRDPSDPPPDANPQITRKTVIRTTTRSGYADIPEDTDKITDYLQLQADPNEPSFLSPSRGGPHVIDNSDIPDRDNMAYYLGLHNPDSSQVVHPAPSRNRAIKDNVSIA